MPDLKKIKWKKIQKNIKSFFINGADFVKYKFTKLFSIPPSNADEKTVNKKKSASLPLSKKLSDEYLLNLLNDIISKIKNNVGKLIQCFKKDGETEKNPTEFRFLKGNSLRYVIVSAIIALSAITGYSFSFMKHNDNEALPVYVEIPVTEFVQTTPEIIEETVTEETVNIPLPDLTADVFAGNSLEIFHTDFKPSAELEQKINSLANGYNKNFSVYMVNLDDYAVFGYNSDLYVPTASTIKLPFAYYCYNEIQKGNHTLDETLQYKAKYYSTGTGVIKDAKKGSYYSIRTLLDYMLTYSDNIAYLMLLDYFGYEGYNEMLSSNGFETFLSEQIQWGELSSHSLGYIWTELYNYRNQCHEGEILYHDVVYAQSNFLKRALEENGYTYQVAHKSGWASPGYHDAGIVLTEHPYVLVVMTESEGNTKDQNFFSNMVIAMNELHDEYLTYTGKEPSQQGASTPLELMPVELNEGNPEDEE